MNALDMVNKFLRTEAPPSEKPLRIMIAVPSGDRVHVNFAMCLANMQYRLGLLRYHVASGNTKGSMIQNNRNKLVDLAEKLQCAKIFFIDSDMTFPADTLERLVAHGKPVVGATYAQRVGKHKNLAKPLGNVRTEVATDELVEVDALPGGCVLIDMAVFKALKRPYFRMGYTEEDPANGVEPMTHGEDYDFFPRAKAAGFPCYLDPKLSYELIHWGEVGWRLSDTPINPESDAEMVEMQES